MTTPARNIDYYSSGDFVETYPDGSKFFGTNSTADHHVDVRPESVTSQRVRGFKKCAEFEHVGGVITKDDSSCSYSPNGAPRSRYVFSGSIWGGTTPYPELASSNMSNKCLVKALGKLKDQDFHLANFVAESHQAINMVTGAAKTIAQGVKYYRHRNPKDFDIARGIMRDGLPRYLWCKIPSTWLQLVYGWIPLMSDIFGAVNHLKKRGRFDVPFVTVRAKESDETYTTTRHRQVTTLSQCLARWTNKREVHTFLIYGLKNARLAELSSLGLINPLEVVWETTRFSFVVDWFLPIGPWLGSLTADVGYDFITGGQSYKSALEFTSSQVDYVDSDVTFHNNPAIHCSGKMEAFKRTCYGSSPFPGLYVKNPLSTLHLMNALALLAQVFQRR